MHDNGFAAKVFGIMDEDDSRMLSFTEFVAATWNICTLTRGPYIAFVFSLFDQNRDGWIGARSSR